MNYEEIQAKAVEVMSAESVFEELESFIADEPQAQELLVLGATIGAGFGCPETARQLLLHLCLMGDFPYEAYRVFVDHPNPESLLHDAGKDSKLGSILRGLGFGAGFISTDKGFAAVATLSELSEIAYSSPGPRSEYRAPVPSWLLDGEECY